MAALGSESSGMESFSLESAQQFLQESLTRVRNLQNLDSTGAQDLLDFTIRSDTLGYTQSPVVILINCALKFILSLLHTETCRGSGSCRRNWLDRQIFVQHTCTVSFCL